MQQQHSFNGCCSEMKKYKYIKLNVCVCIRTKSFHYWNSQQTFTIHDKKKEPSQPKLEAKVLYSFHNTHTSFHRYHIPNTKYTHIVFSWKSNLFFYFPFDSLNSRTTMIMKMRIFFAVVVVQKSFFWLKYINLLFVCLCGFRNWFLSFWHEKKKPKIK